MAVTRPLPRPVKRGFLHPYDNWANRIATHRFVVDIPSGQGTPTDAALARIEQSLPLLRQQRVLLLWGGRDFCFNRHYFERWREVLPEAEAHFLPKAGHYLLEDAPEVCLSLIQKHLQP